LVLKLANGNRHEWRRAQSSNRMGSGRTFRRVAKAVDGHRSVRAVALIETTVT
jgi:hypothetical protein